MCVCVFGRGVSVICDQRAMAIVHRGLVLGSEGGGCSYKRVFLTSAKLWFFIFPLE